MPGASQGVAGHAKSKKGSGDGPSCVDGNVGPIGLAKALPRDGSQMMSYPADEVPSIDGASIDDRGSWGSLSQASSVVGG